MGKVCYAVTHYIVNGTILIPITAVQIFLEELKDAYGVEWTTTLINIMTNDQKNDWFLKLDPNGITTLLA